MGWPNRWVDNHIEVTRKESQGLLTYPQTWKNPVCECFDKIADALDKAEAKASNNAGYRCFPDAGSAGPIIPG
jgi:hypothetical protein